MPPPETYICKYFITFRTLIIIHCNYDKDCFQRPQQNTSTKQHNKVATTCTMSHIIYNQMLNLTKQVLEYKSKMYKPT